MPADDAHDPVQPGNRRRRFWWRRGLGLGRGLGWWLRLRRQHRFGSRRWWRLRFGNRDRLRCGGVRHQLGDALALGHLPIQDADLFRCATLADLDHGSTVLRFDFLVVVGAVPGSDFGAGQLAQLPLGVIDQRFRLLVGGRWVAGRERALVGARYRVIDVPQVGPDLDVVAAVVLHFEARLIAILLDVAASHAGEVVIGTQRAVLLR